ncbi:meiotic recombination protein SPO11-2 isoform X2 [Glycine soja]|uniref:meiotic recombination protein SPO11-2 isoform X2 n=1 Tax=Glycine max TaxID=3847 RepID=UPI0007193FDE|nr:meiotic recombination protein SPO11-2 isoform X2 [Glycine max]XP_028189127.1 meiotic recombination protein SPO11-2 isoform X2 [Glycine soja]|eukprot:XP_014619258.1 meiotic recombination protein SPO11-2 isoform X2 [Glycine max]
MEDLRNLTLKFFSDQELCYADIVPLAQVRARIEVSVLNFLKILNASSPAISDLPLIQRKYSNSRVNHGLLTELSRVFLSNSVSTRSLMRPNAAKAFVRVWKVMEMCYQILLQEKRVTQRELFYKLLCDSPHLFPSQTHVNRTIQGYYQCVVCFEFNAWCFRWEYINLCQTDLVALLRCSRFSLGIMASSRGLVAGRLILQEPGKEAVDCSLCGSSGFAISGDLNLLDSLVLNADARYVIIVEKHAIFQRLTEDRFFHQIPSILITAKGYPDIATRNPAGLAILCTFKFGSIGMGLEAYRYACNVKWLGLRGHDLPLLPNQSFVPLKPKDLQIAQSLMSSGILQDNYKEEVALMVQSGRRAEIEALYFNGYDYLGKYIAKKIVQSDYV